MVQASAPYPDISTHMAVQLNYLVGSNCYSNTAEGKCFPNQPLTLELGLNNATQR